MRFSQGVSLALLTVASTLACAKATTAPSVQSEEAAIRALTEQFARASSAHDAAAVTAFYAADARLLPPNAPMATGTDAIRAAWVELFKAPNLALSLSPGQIDVSNAGDMAVDVGTYQVSFDGPDGRVNESGKYTVAWRKMNAEWKVFADAWNSDQPPPAAPANVAAAPAAAPADGDEMGVYASRSLKWTPLELPGFKPGIQMTVIHGDPSTEGDYTLRLRFPGGYAFPSHWHPNGEHLTVIRGTFKLGMGAKEDAAGLKTYAPGDFIYIPGKMPHFGSVIGVTEIQLHGMGPFQVVLSSGA